MKDKSKRKLEPILALAAVNTNSLSAELNLTGANSVKIYVEITGAGTVQIEALGSSISGGVFIGNGTTKYCATSQSYIIPCTSDFMKMQLTITRGTPTVTVRVQGLTECGITEVVPTYKDLGLIISGTNVIAGGTVMAASIYDVQWVRNIIFLLQSDQTAIINITNKDTAGTSNWGQYASSSLPAAGGSWDGVIITGVNAILGHACAVSVKNNSVSTATFLSLRMQLLGV